MRDGRSHDRADRPPADLAASPAPGDAGGPSRTPNRRDPVSATVHSALAELPERLIELVLKWSGPMLWEATWKLSSEAEKLKWVFPEDPEYNAARARIRWAEEKFLDRLDQLEEINRLVEQYAPDLLGQVPERPLDPPFDHAAALRVGQQMKTLLGLLLAKQRLANGSAAEADDSGVAGHHVLPDRPATTDLYPLAAALLAECQREQRKPTVTWLAGQLGVSRP